MSEIKPMSNSENKSPLKFLVPKPAVPTATAQEGWHSVRQDYWLCDFHSVFFLPDGQTGWAVGGYGTILHTTDGGSSWQSQTSGTSNDLWSVHFVDGQNGWAVGEWGIVLKYTATAPGGER